MPGKSDARRDRFLRAAMILAGMAILLTVLGRFYHDAFRDFLAREQPSQAAPGP